MEITVRLTNDEICEAVAAWLEEEHCITVPEEFTRQLASWSPHGDPLTVCFAPPEPAEPG